MSNPFSTEELPISGQPLHTNAQTKLSRNIRSRSQSLELSEDQPSGADVPKEAMPGVGNLFQAHHTMADQNERSKAIVSFPSDFPQPFDSQTATTDVKSSRYVQSSHQPASPSLSRNLDVGSFTSLLMKGVQDPSEVTSNINSASSGYSATNTNIPGEQSGTSSYFNTLEGNKAQLAAQAMPKTNLDIESQNTTKAGRQVDRSSKPPPLPPKSRHGKTLQAIPRGPQTVPFDDFFPTAPIEASPKTPVDSLISPKEYRLPKPTSESPHEHQPSTSSPQHEPEANIMSPFANDTKRVPPPPPLSRRSTVSKRSTANMESSVTLQSDDTPGSYTPSIAESTESSRKIAPIPPPSRRSMCGNSALTKSLASLADSTQERSQDIRNSSFSQGRLRSSSGASMNSSQPPPPPPARRKSSRASIDSNTKIPAQPASTSNSRRASAEIPRSSIDSQRWLPPASNQFDGPIAEETKDDTTSPTSASQMTSRSSVNNVLADMEEFQREIDELRAKYK